MRAVASCLLAAGLLSSLAPRPSLAQDTSGPSTEAPGRDNILQQGGAGYAGSGTDSPRRELSRAADILSILSILAEAVEEEDEEFLDWSEEGEEFADWEDEGEEPPSGAPLRQEIVLEFRVTDVFDELPAPPLTAGPPPEGVYYLSDEITLAPGEVLKIESEYLRYDDASIADRGRLLVLWEPTLRSGAYLDFDATHLWDDEGGTGFAAGVALGWQAGPNMDLYARVGGSKSLTGVLGGGASGQLMAALGRHTALQARASYYLDETRGTSVREELELAQYLGRHTGLHLLVRSNRSTIEDVGFEDTNSLVTSVGLRHVFAERTLVRGAFRWYSDTAGVKATGVSLGVEQGFARGSVGAYYRRYVSNEEVTAGTWEDVKAGTWWVTAKLRF